ncbi:MAG: tRNA (adenosine(37)-N6)-dimethylallyltransferase MiaA [Candidatus Aminicenantes bacterium]|nr:tRNA (adenosine(37)-N6)-dimethylallyltransferase MiaA [Candidatus Aminicenantes bacterium]
MNKLDRKNLVCVLGPTGVGKSRISLRLAKTFGGEIINCDSMQVYKGFDIGTDKIAPSVRQKIPHHLIDIKSPWEQFTAAEFARLSLEAAEDILKRGLLPIITGGTGLYFSALFNGLFPEGQKDPSVRTKLEAEFRKKGLESLRQRLEEIDPGISQRISPNDKIRIIRALEVFETTGIPMSHHFQKTRSFVEDYFVLKIGLILERDLLVKKIEKRVDRMFERGIIQEVQTLLDSGISSHVPAFRALGYKHVLNFLNGKTTKEEAVLLMKQDTRRYAKRQKTWFRKMKGIRWFSPKEFRPIREYIEKNLK